jgi:hypothetical protein
MSCTSVPYRHRHDLVGTVTALREHTECEWPALEHLVKGPDGKFRLPVMPERLPLMFTLEARK